MILIKIDVVNYVTLKYINSIKEVGDATMKEYKKN